MAKCAFEHGSSKTKAFLQVLHLCPHVVSFSFLFCMCFALSSFASFRSHFSISLLCLWLISLHFSDVIAKQLLEGEKNMEKGGK